MNEPEAHGIVFEVETSRILQILSKEIYDSPYAMLRENVQNCYDAILMRNGLSEGKWNAGAIDIEIAPRQVVIRDNGIGMTEEVLRNNFWRAGSSGKRNKLAQDSGVVGTFGIGAMANFGVCERLRVETRHVESDYTLTSIAERQTLSISKECVQLYKARDDREPGTTVTADLAADATIDINQARAYLRPYVQFLPYPVNVAGALYGNRTFEEELQLNSKQVLFSGRVSNGSLSFVAEISVDAEWRASVKLSDLEYGSESVRGTAVLLQRPGPLMGLRNYFGLAPAPNAGIYGFSGFANFSFLEPTAGREALSRDSVQRIHELIGAVELKVTETLADTNGADVSGGFQNYVASHERYDLAQRVAIEVLPSGDRVALGDVKSSCAGKTLLKYAGRDQAILRTFASEQSCLLHISQGNPRRQIQSGYIARYLPIEDVPDRATITLVYDTRELTFAEVGFQIRLTNVLLDDYFLGSTDVVWCEISHGLPFVVRKEDDVVRIYVARNSVVVRPVLEVYETAFEVFTGFVRDLVRGQMYPLLQQYVPSATREGAEALRRALQRNRELYRYEESELGSLEPLIADLLAGTIDLGDVIKSARFTAGGQSQRVAPNQVGDIQEILPDIVESPTTPELTTSYEPRPPILRDEVQSDLKLLTVDDAHEQLSGFRVFLALSDRLFNREAAFFRQPHTSRVIWGGHRVIYIFTHASGALSLYYDIEFRQPMAGDTTGGTAFPSTTIITKNRIYIPVSDQIADTFKPTEGYKEFFVRFDTLAG